MSGERVFAGIAKALAQDPAYREALKNNPDMADAHYNLALLCEASGLHQEAVRHLNAFRKQSR